ncbi:hypothetical protein ABMA28_005303 [Loxostege sticticalis]|uniref:Uncharacterized protein n=1 Tax=Loxostege sticticalis TaxID=481309 RepID=A0ABD0SPY2_LOXSC
MLVLTIPTSPASHDGQDTASAMPLVRTSLQRNMKFDNGDRSTTNAAAAAAPAARAERQLLKPGKQKKIKEKGAQAASEENETATSAF